MLKAAIAHSEDVDLTKAVDEILGEIRSELGDTTPQAGVLFCSIDFDHSYILSRLRTAFPSMELVGCTTDGEMSPQAGFSEDSIVFIALAADKAEIRAGVGRDMSGSGLEAGRNAAEAALLKLKSGKEACKFALILADPLNAGVSEIFAGTAQVLGPAFPLLGGASAAHSKRRATYQFCNGEILTDSVVLLLFSGPLLFSYGIKGGHSAIGGKEKITASSKNVLYKIGDRPALEYLHRYVGTNHDIFMNYCMAIFEEDREGFYVRSAPFCDEEKGTVTLNGVVNEGAYIQIGTADKSTCAESCEESVRLALDSYPGTKPAAAFFVSCAGRKKMLGTQAVKESQIAKAYLEDVPFAGYYAFGEFAPLFKGGETLFHGTTFVTLLVGEE